MGLAFSSSRRMCMTMSHMNCRIDDRVLLDALSGIALDKLSDAASNRNSNADLYAKVANVRCRRVILYLSAWLASARLLRAANHRLLPTSFNIFQAETPKDVKNCARLSTSYKRSKGNAKGFIFWKSLELLELDLADDLEFVPSALDYFLFKSFCL